MGVVKAPPRATVRDGESARRSFITKLSGTPCMPASRRLSLQYERGTAGTQPAKSLERGGYRTPFTLSRQGECGWTADQRNFRVRLSSNSPPFDAPTSEPASISASPAGGPDAFQRGSEIGFAGGSGRPRFFPLCLLSSAARSLQSSRRYHPPVRKFWPS